MASIYQLKSKFQGVLRPVVKGLAKAGVTANQVTFFACILSMAIGLYFYIVQPQGAMFFIFPVFLFVRMALNAIDGLLAREHNMQTSLGAILNELTDVVADAFLYFPLAYLWGVNMSLNALFIFISTLTEMTGVIAIQIGASRRYDGPLGKSDRAFIFGSLALLTGFGVDISNWANPIFYALTFLVSLTVYNRAAAALKEIK